MRTCLLIRRWAAAPCLTLRQFVDSVPGAAARARRLTHLRPLVLTGRLVEIQRTVLSK